MPDLIGKTIGSYRIVGQIGLGGMATVFKAYQPSMDRYVALKVLSTHLAQDSSFIKRFQQEAKIIAKLEHLHILPVYDHGEQDGYLYLVMRFIEAGTLKDRLQQGQLSLDEARRVVIQVGSALEYAHQLGVIHRDMKPSNVLVDPQGDCYLTDFGISKIVEGTLGLTGSSIIGTPHYMAPEQSRSHTVDHRADIYAMGVVIYEMVTGRLPFDAETPFAVVMKHISEPLPLPRTIRPDLPEAVERVILRTLAKDPADRYQSMRDLVTAFDQAVQTAPDKALAPRASAAREPAAAPALTPTVLISRRASLQRWLAAQPPWLLPAAALALVVLVLAGVILSRIPGRVEIAGGQVQLVTPTAAATPTSVVTPVTAPTRAPQMAVTLTPAPISLERGEILGECENDLCIFDYKGVDKTRLGLAGIYGGFGGMSWSPDGSRIVFSGCLVTETDRIPCWDIYVASRDGRNVTPLVYSPATHDFSPVWSPDGGWVAYNQNGALKMIRPDGTDARTLAADVQRACSYSIAWSPDSQRIAGIGGTCGTTNDRADSLWVVNRDGSGMHSIFQSSDPQLGRAWLGQIAWSPDGKSVAVMMETGAAYLIDANCASRPKGCDESSRTRLDTIPKHWLHTFYPQWAGERTGAVAPTPASSSQDAQARAFAEPILKAITNKQPDYQDDFSNPKTGWTVASYLWGERAGETGYRDGKFFLVADPASVQYPAVGSWLEVPALQVSDFVMEFDAQFISTESGALYVFFRVRGKDGYAVDWMADGQVRLSTQTISDRKLLAEAKGDPVKPNEVNHLRIIAKGPQIVLYLNDRPMVMAREEFTDRGVVVLGIWNKASTPMQVNVDNFKVWDTSKLSTP